MRLRLLIGVLMIYLFASCNKHAKIDELEKLLGASLHSFKVEELYIKKKLWTPNYKRPYNIYITFNISGENAERLFERLGLEKYDESKQAMPYGEDSIFCFYANSLAYYLWCIKPFRDYEYNEISEIGWWRPDTISKEHMYAFYYKLPDNESAKIGPCSMKNIDGRITAEYVPDQKKVYILIRV